MRTAARVKLLNRLVPGARQVLSTFAQTAGALPILALSLLLGLAYSFVLPFMSLFGTREVGMSAFGFGVFMTATSLSSVLMSTWLAKWSDTRVSRRKVLLLGGVTGALGYVGYAFLRQPWLLTCCGVSFLALSSVTFGQLFALARDMLARGGASPRELPLYLNVVRLFFALAWTVGPAVGSLLVARSFELAFLAAAGIFSLFTAVVAIFVPEVAPTDDSRRAASQLPLALAFRNPALVGNFLAFVLYFACSTMGMMNLPLLLLRDLGGSEHQIGVAYAVAPVFELPFMLYVGVLATRIRHERLVVIALLIAAAYYAGLARARGPEHVYVLQIASAAIVAVMSGVAITFFQSFLPDQAGTATNLYSTASRVGSMLGYLSFGAIADRFGHRAVFLVSVGATLVSAAVVHVFRGHRSPPARAA